MEVKRYCSEIKKGETPSGLYCKKAVDRFISDLKRIKDADFDYIFLKEKADVVVDFAESLTIPDIQTADRRLKLLPWMKFIYYQLFGWYHKENTNKRRFRGGYIEVARKNSKTTSLLFPIILYDFFTTRNAEAYLVSRDTLQAEKTFKEIKMILKADPRLSKIIHKTIYDVTCKNSRIAFFSSESISIDGYRNSCSLFDEFHSYMDDRIVSSFRYGSRARENTLNLIITSAGLNISGPCYAENEKARKILNGIYQDESYFTIIYAYDETDDWKDPANFIKANPSIGVVLRKEVLENDLADALLSPSRQPDFKAKTCGVWTSGVSNWISQQVIDSLRAVTVKEFHGEDCWGGFDLSSVNDFTALTVCFKTAGGWYHLLHRFFIPAETFSERYMKENINLLDWVNKGLVTLIPGATIDYDYLIDAFIEIARDNKLQTIAYDPWQSREVLKRLENELPQTALVEFSQSIKKMSLPTKNFEKLLIDKKIISDNPVFLWMLGNATIKTDVNGNYKPLKENRNSRNRIDGVISAIMAVQMANSQAENHNLTFDEILALF
jgi:phage terminase large subunit-like protein